MADEKGPVGAAIQAAAAVTIVLSATGFLAVRAHLQSLQLPSHASPGTEGYLEIGGRIVFGVVGQLVVVLVALLLLWLAGALLARWLPSVARLPRHRVVLAVGLPLLGIAALAFELSSLDAVVDLDALTPGHGRSLLRPVIFAEALLAMALIWMNEVRWQLDGWLRGTFLQRQFSAVVLLLFAAAVLMLPVAFGRTEMLPTRFDQVELVTERGSVKGLLVFSDASSHFIWTDRRALTEIARDEAKEIRYEPRADVRPGQR